MISYLLYFWMAFLAMDKNTLTDIPPVSPDEEQLFNLINEYRVSRGLEVIPLSAPLTKVAQVHARDLMENYKRSNRCNMHSWSKEGNWRACCYRDNHKDPNCMWDKPREIAGYDSPGYEIAYWHSAAAEPKEALEVWKKSPGHHSVLANLAPFRDANWKAMGVGIYREYAVVWFGEMED
ncbi:MAG: CAP domain-containing protein [Cyclobacteriaceae bacterium]